jgi:hypothetical protein
LLPGSWWLRPLLIAFLPCGLGFFHEVGAKLLVEIGPEGGRRHNNPLMAPPSFEGDTTEGPLRDEWNTLLLSLPSLSKLLYITTKLLLLIPLLLPPYAKKDTKHSEPKALGSNRSLHSLFSLMCLFSYKGTSIYRRP